MAQPDGTPRGAVVVLQEIFGVNSHIRAVTDRLAARGFVAIAPALFTRLEFDVQLGYDAEAMARGIQLKAAAEALPGEGVMQDVRAAVQWVAQHSGCKVGVVGFCWGGLLTWRAAGLIEGVSAAVCYYGGGMTVPPEIARQPQVPVLCMCMTPTTALTATSAAAMTMPAPCRPRTARWSFWTST